MRKAFSKYAVHLTVAVLLLPVVVWGATKIRGALITDSTIQNSTIQSTTIDSSAIGSITPANGNFLSLVGSSLNVSGTSTLGVVNAGALSGSSVTSTGLPSGNCVHTSTGGLLTNATGDCITAAQDQNWTTPTLCTLANSTDDGCTGTISLPVAYGDASYTVECMTNNSNGTFTSISLTTPKSAGSFSYSLTCTFNCGAAATSNTAADCHAHHD